MIEFLTILFIVIGVAAFVFPLILCIVYVPESNKSTTIIIYLLIGSILMLGYIDKASRIIAREQAIMDQKKAEEQYQFEKSAAPTVNPARIGKDIEETIKLVKELFSRFKDSKEVSKELETISKNLKDNKPLDTKEITFLRNKAVEKGLVVRPSYVRQTLKFPDTIGDETRQLFGDVVRRGGKTTLIDSAAEAYRRGDLEVINGVVEPDSFGGFTVKWERGSGGDITFRDKKTGAYFEDDTRKIIQPTQDPTPGAGAAPSEKALSREMLSSAPPSDAYKAMETKVDRAFDEIRSESDIDIAVNYAESSIPISELSDAEAAKLREHIQSLKKTKLEELDKSTAPEKPAAQPKAPEPAAEPVAAKEPTAKPKFDPASIKLPGSDIVLPPSNPKSDAFVQKLIQDKYSLFGRDPNSLPYNRNSSTGQGDALFNTIVGEIRKNPELSIEEKQSALASLYNQIENGSFSVKDTDGGTRTLRVSGAGSDTNKKRQISKAIKNLTEKPIGDTKTTSEIGGDNTQPQEIKFNPVEAQETSLLDAYKNITQELPDLKTLEKLKPKDAAKVFLDIRQKMYDLGSPASKSTQEARWNLENKINQLERETGLTFNYEKGYLYEDPEFESWGYSAKDKIPLDELGFDSTQKLPRLGSEIDPIGYDVNSAISKVYGETQNLIRESKYNYFRNPKEYEQQHSTLLDMLQNKLIPSKKQQLDELVSKGKISIDKANNLKARLDETYDLVASLGADINTHGDPAAETLVHFAKKLRESKTEDAIKYYFEKLKRDVNKNKRNIFLKDPTPEQEAEFWSNAENIFTNRKNQLAGRKNIITEPPQESLAKPETNSPVQSVDTVDAPTADHQVAQSDTQPIQDAEPAIKHELFSTSPEMTGERHVWSELEEVGRLLFGDNYGRPHAQTEPVSKNIMRPKVEATAPEVGAPAAEPKPDAFKPETSVEPKAEGPRNPYGFISEERAKASENAGVKQKGDLSVLLAGIRSGLRDAVNLAKENVKSRLQDVGKAVKPKVQTFAEKMRTPSEEITNNTSWTEVLKPHQGRVADTMENVVENVARGAGVVAKPVGRKATKIVSDGIARVVDAMNPIIRDESTGTKTPLQALKDEFLRLRAAKHDRLRLNAENRSLDELANQRPLQYHINPEKNIGEKQISLGPNGETVVPITPELNQLLADGAVRVTGNVGRRTNRITGSSELYGLEPGSITLEDLRVTNKPSTASGGSSAGIESMHPTFTFEAPEAPMPDFVASKAKGGRRAGGNAASSGPSEFWSPGANLRSAWNIGKTAITTPFKYLPGTLLGTAATLEGVSAAINGGLNYLDGTRQPVTFGEMNSGFWNNGMNYFFGPAKDSPVLETRTNPDDTQTIINPFGSETIINADGSLATRIGRDSAGNTTVDTYKTDNGLPIESNVTTKNGDPVQKTTYKPDGTPKIKTIYNEDGSQTINETDPDGKVRSTTISPPKDPNFGDWMTKNVVPEYFSKPDNFGSYGHSLFGALAGSALGAGIGGLNYILTDENELSEEEKKKRSLARAMLSSAGIGAGIGGLVGGASDYTRA